MKKLILYTFISITFLQCSGKNEKTITQDKSSTEQTIKKPQTKKQENPHEGIISKGGYYFEFDELIYYKLKKEINPFKLVEKKSLTKEEQTTYDYFFEDAPKDIKKNHS